MAAIGRRGNEDGACKYSDSHNVRTCIQHFHPSVTQCDDDGAHSLKTGSSPTSRLTEFAMNNESFKEEKITKDCWFNRRCSIDLQL